MSVRTGGRLVAESLAALGAQAVFGVPGIHALPIWEGLRESELRLIGARTELGAGFAADGYARTSGRPAVLLLSTGPGALNALTALMEAASAHVPIVAVASQIPSALLGTGRGYLHKLDGQRDAVAAVVKHAARARTAAEIPQRLAEAFAIAAAPPSGPVFVEIPVDLLSADPGRAEPPRPPTPGGAPPAGSEAVAEAARLLAGARRPVLWAGGGVLRSGAQAELRALAERLDAPVVTTFMGKGALGDEHPLAVGSGCDEAAVQSLIADADVVLAVGTELGADTTAQYALALTGELIHLDAAPQRIGASYPALGLVGDARATLAAVRQALPDAPSAAAEPGAPRAAAVRERIRTGLIAQGRGDELRLLATVQDALPAGGMSTWDMTILAYWAAAHLRLRSGQRFHYPLGSGTLGYAWPAALGAAVAEPGRRVLAVCGDGGLAYGLAELATARQHDLDATLLVVDDGGYGILREYQREDYGHTVAVDLVQPDLARVADAFGVPVRAGGLDSAAENLRWGLSADGPAVVVVRARLAAPAPTP
ncbi:MAG TPA: thiamine pyrophosphate-binding protein [Solirubrobacteraceae bacterium]|nr:thiamine pyrophosphate-binding protein [Solirubrobacteraceae bacterium]